MLVPSEMTASVPCSAMCAEFPVKSAPSIFSVAEAPTSHVPAVSAPAERSIIGVLNDITPDATSSVPLFSNDGPCTLVVPLPDRTMVPAAVFLTNGRLGPQHQNMRLSALMLNVLLLVMLATPPRSDRTWSCPPVQSIVPLFTIGPDSDFVPPDDIVSVTESSTVKVPGPGEGAVGPRCRADRVDVRRPAQSAAGDVESEGSERVVGGVQVEGAAAEVDRVGAERCGRGRVNSSAADVQCAREERMGEGPSPLLKLVVAPMPLV